MRLDLLLIRHHPELSRRQAREVIEKGQVTVGGSLVREPGCEVAETTEVRLDRNRPALSRARSSLPVLYQDEHVIVVDKPAGLLTVPTAPGLDEDTALRRVQDYAHRLSPHAGFAERVHRLDRDTSGALAFALSREARAGLIRTFRDHRIERVYLALVAGRPREVQGEVDAPLRDEWTSGRRAVAREGEPARPALTRWRLVERFADAALLEVRIETGRQHQIRLHLAHVGLPILGDPVYGVSGGRLARRPLLHALRLGFAHPITGEQVSVESPWPKDLQEAVAALRRGQRLAPRQPSREPRDGPSHEPRSRPSHEPRSRRSHEALDGRSREGRSGQPTTRPRAATTRRRRRSLS